MSASAVVAIAASLTLAGCIAAVERSGSPGVSGGSAVTLFPSPVPGPTGPTPVPSFVRPTPTPAPTFLVYVVKTGDNLGTIARRYGTTARSIAFWNRGSYPTLDPEAATYRPDLVRIGWTLLLIPNVTFDEQSLPGPSTSDTSAPS
ncbi:MAG TPA: LysM domain-containing protein [Candidatus Bathyarchaeia archaeon]|nr:LysM domain-containing protein [Candidatus Bathyarchaeia archaeon]